MSATNRGAKRIASDFYPTPIESFIPVMPFVQLMPGPFWEPACGDRRLVRHLLGEGLTAYGTDLSVGHDFLDPGFQAEVMIGTKEVPRFRSIVTNPPFSKAEEFLTTALSMTDHVMFLLRVGFLGSIRRHKLLNDHPPRAMFVLSKRPRFVNGRSDASEYAWISWSPAHLQCGIQCVM